MCRCFFSVSCLQVLEAFRNDTGLSLPETGFYVVNLVIFSVSAHDHRRIVMHTSYTIPIVLVMLVGIFSWRGLSLFGIVIYSTVHPLFPFLNRLSPMLTLTTFSRVFNVLCLSAVSPALSVLFVFFCLFGKILENSGHASSGRPLHYCMYGII